MSIARLLAIPALVLVFAAPLATAHVHAALMRAVTLEPAHFVPAAGWHLREGRAHACVGVSASRCSQATSVASTISLRDCLECLPHHTVAVMRAKDIAIKIGVALEHPIRAKRTFTWPPRVTRRMVIAGFEGLPGRIGVYERATLIGRRAVSVFVVFGCPVPTNEQLKRANGELRRARFR